MAAANCWPTEQPPAKRPRIEPPFQYSGLHINADTITDRLTFHAKWAMDKRPALVNNAIRNGIGHELPPPLQEYGIQVYLPLQETDPNKLLPIVAGYLNLSNVNQLSILWKAIDQFLDDMCTKQKEAYGASDEYVQSHPDGLHIDPATLMRLLTTGVVTEQNTHSCEMEHTLARIERDPDLSIDEHARYFHFGTLLRRAMARLTSDLPVQLDTLGVTKIFIGQYRINIPFYGVLCHETDAIWGLYQAEDVFRFYMLWRAFDVVKNSVGSVDSNGTMIIPECLDVEVQLPLFAIRPGCPAPTTAALDLTPDA